ncbi:hypothetical protein GGS24DRAFT_501100 [Hypoxylon argillaceum]|nr:hypothetical protein GGS24DRAFT_501100 [Hypoxylon argillaceum]
MANTEAITIVTVFPETSQLCSYEENQKFLALDEEQDYAADSFTDVEQLTSHTNNTGRRTPVRQTRQLPFLRITTCDTHNPKDPEVGFVFGSDANICDIVLDQNCIGGISRKQFAITGNWKTGILLIRNLSDQGTDIDCVELGKIKLSSQRILPISEDLRIEIASIMIRIRCPDHRYMRKRDWKAYCKKMQLRVPGLEQLNLKSVLKTTKTPREPNYRIGRQIGRGACGRVYEVTNFIDGKIYAAKQTDMADTFRKEEAALKRISHKHIVQFEHVWKGKEDTSPMLIMELVERGDLLTVTKARRLTADELREGLRQLLTAMAYVHGEGITHRDIKPANIMVQSRKPLHLKLTDFGLASISKDLWTRCGTPLYCAPELGLELRRASGENYSNKIDIWSIGIVALEFFYGLPPYDEKTCHDWPATLNRHLGSLQPNMTVRFISSLLQVDPSRRPTAMQSLQHPFFAAPLQPIAVPNNRISVQSEGILDEQNRQVRSLLYNDTAKITAVHGDQESTLSWTTQIHTSSRDRPTQHSEIKHSTRIVSSSGHGRIASQVASITNNSSNEATSDSSSGNEESTILYCHSDWLRDPLIVGSEIEKILAHETTAMAETTTTGRTNTSGKEHEDSQLPGYDFTTIPRTNQHLITQAPSLAQPTNANGLDHNGGVVLSDQYEPYFTGLSYNNILGYQATAEANASQPSGYNARDGTINYPSVGAHVTHSPLRHLEATSSIASHYLREFYNDPSKSCGVIENEPRHSIARQGNDIPAVEAHPPEASQHLDARLTVHDLDDIRYILIQNQRVSIRISDNYLNATEICAAAGLGPRECRRCLRPLKASRVGSVDNRAGLWVPFSDGVTLGRQLDLPNLEHLFSPTSRPIQEDVLTNLERDNAPVHQSYPYQADGVMLGKTIRRPHEGAALPEPPNTRPVRSQTNTSQSSNPRSISRTRKRKHRDTF